MLLSFNPNYAAALEVDPALFTHDFPTPSGIQKTSVKRPVKIKMPFAYARTRLDLAELDIVGYPGWVASDRALWITVVAREVKWNLESGSNGAVTVRCSDGRYVEWELDGSMLGDVDQVSQDFVGTSGDDHPGPTSSKPIQQPRSTPSQKRPSKLASSLSRLDELAVETSLALEELINPAFGEKSLLNSADLAGEYATLLSLAANPSTEFPRRWRVEEIDSMDAGFVSVFDIVRDKDGDIKMIEGTQSRFRDADDSSSSETDDDQPTSGQLRRVGRPRCPSINPACLKPSKSSTATSPNSSPSATTDFYYNHSSKTQFELLTKFVSLLTETRTILVDLYALYVVPRLNEIFEPTYSLFAASSAFNWCHQIAKLEGKILAEQINYLRLDEGDYYATDEEEDESEEEDFEDELAETDDDELDDGYERRRRRSSSLQRDLAREQRKDRNVLSLMKDDYSLMMWCGRALGKVRNLDETDVGTKVWFEEFKPWPVEMPYDQPLKTQTRSASKKSSNLSASPTPIHRASRAPNSASETSDADNYPPLFDPFSPDSSSPYFDIEDPLSLELLPRRLPTSVIRVKPFPPLPKEMESLKQELRQSLNKLSGIQKKMVELAGFITVHRQAYKTSHAEERDGGDPKSTYRAVPKDITPIGQQPLRLSTADRTISKALLGTPLVTNDGSTTIKSNAKSPSKAATKAIVPPTPGRRKKMSNISILERVENGLEKTKKVQGVKRNPSSDILGETVDKKRKIASAEGTKDFTRPVIIPSSISSTSTVSAPTSPSPSKVKISNGRKSKSKPKLAVKQSKQKRRSSSGSTAESPVHDDILHSPLRNSIFPGVSPPASPPCSALISPFTQPLHQSTNSKSSPPLFFSPSTPRVLTPVVLQRFGPVDIALLADVASTHVGPKEGGLAPDFGSTMTWSGPAIKQDWQDDDAFAEKDFDEEVDIIVGYDDHAQQIGDTGRHDSREMLLDERVLYDKGEGLIDVEIDGQVNVVEIEGQGCMEIVDQPWLLYRLHSDHSHITANSGDHFESRSTSSFLESFVSSRHPSHSTPVNNDLSATSALTRSPDFPTSATRDLPSILTPDPLRPHLPYSTLESIVFTDGPFNNVENEPPRPSLSSSLNFVVSKPLLSTPVHVVGPKLNRPSTSSSSPSSTNSDEEESVSLEVAYALLSSHHSVKTDEKEDESAHKDERNYHIIVDEGGTSQ